MTAIDTRDVVIIGAELFDGTGAPPLADPVLTIGGGRVQSVEARAPGWTPPSGVKVLDRSRSTILPGLIDSHVHLAMTAPPAWPAEQVPADRAEDAWLMAGIQRAQAALAAGVTTIRDCGSAALCNIALRESRAAGFWTGPRILACGLPLTTTGGHLHRIGLRCDSADELRRGVRWNAERGADFIKIALTGGMSTPGSVPSRLQYSLEELAAAVEDAHRLGLKVAAHVLSTEGVIAAAKAGVDTVEHCWSVTGAPQAFRPEAVDALRDSGGFGSVTAHRHLRQFLAGESGEGDFATLRSRLEPHRALRAAGVSMLVHSDSDGVKNRFDGFAESLEVFQLGLDASAADAIAAATGLAARALGIDREVGTLCPDRLADVLVVDGLVSDDIRALRRVSDVFLSGEAVVTGRHVLQAAAAV